MFLKGGNIVDIRERDRERENVITFDGLKKLKEELEYLKSIKRSEIAERIKQAREFGDISENAEFDEAKNEQARLESEIIRLEGTLKNVRIIDEDDINTEIVKQGAKVRVIDIEFNEEIEYTLLGSPEVDLFRNRISVDSPLGAALMGRKVDDIIDVDAPAGILKYKILSIGKS